MGYFDGLTNASFRKDAQGRDVFYPYGTHGRGRIITDAETAERLRRSIKRLYILLLAIIPLLIAIVRLAHDSVIYLVLLVLAVTALTAGYVQQLTRGLPYSEERLTYRESLQNSLRGHSKLGLVFLAVVSAGFVALGGFILALAPAENLALALVLIVFFGLCLLVFLGALILKSRQERTGT
ncbi:MAG: hypothetical protein ACREFM_08765 [Hypericibacter sp.]